jgi:hypothetical protein
MQEADNSPEQVAYYRALEFTVFIVTPWLIGILSKLDPYSHMNMLMDYYSA